VQELGLSEALLGISCVANADQMGCPLHLVLVLLLIGANKLADACANSVIII
jgi:hypothetical protein